MRYEIETKEDGFAVVHTPTKEAVAYFPVLKNEDWSRTERRAELYVALLLRGE